MRLDRVHSTESGSALDSVQELLRGGGQGTQADVGRGGNAYELLFCSGMAWYMGEHSEYEYKFALQAATESCAAALAARVV